MRVAALALLVLGCSAPPYETDPSPDACADIEPDVPTVPASCADEPCRDVGAYAPCARSYVCGESCVTAWSCACVVELAACLGEELPTTICDGEQS